LTISPWANGEYASTTMSFSAQVATVADGSRPMNHLIWLTIGRVSQVGSRLSRSSVSKFDTPIALTRPLARNSSMAFQICWFSNRQSLPISSQGQGAWMR
jgi:hypothetical protein